MKSENFYYYTMDSKSIKSEYLINDMVSNKENVNEKIIVAIVAPTKVNVEEMDITMKNNDMVVVQIDDDAFINCQELKRLIVPNTIRYIGENVFPPNIKIIVEENEFTVVDYIKHIEKNNSIELMSEITLIEPCLKVINKIINILRKSETVVDAKQKLSSFIHEKLKFSDEDSKKTASLILTLKIQALTSIKFDKLKNELYHS